MMKTCCQCGHEGPETDFPWHDRSRQWRRNVCRLCRLKQKRSNYKNTPATKLTRRKSKLKCQYGLTLEQWEAMRYAQEAKCAICCEPTELVVDHNHITGVVRGLLCAACNRAIGILQDDPVLLRRAAEYLESHGVH